MLLKAMRSPSSPCTRLKVIRSLNKAMPSLNSLSIRLNLKVMHLHRNKVMHLHNPSSLRHLPNRSLMSIHCPMCRRDRSPMRAAQTICRSNDEAMRR